MQKELEQIHPNTIGANDHVMTGDHAILERYDPSLVVDVFALVI